MAQENKSAEQNIDGVLEKLKQSYSVGSTDNNVNTESASENFSRDELQERLRSQFLNGDAESEEKQNDEYSIDEDFLQEAYSEDEEIFETEKIQEDIKENDYELYEGYGEDHKEASLEEEIEQEDENDKEASLYQEPQEIQEEYFDEEYQEDAEIFLYEGSEEVQKEEYYEAFEANDEAEEDKEIQESDSQGVQISKDEQELYFEDDEDYSLWHENDEDYRPIILEDDGELDAPIDAFDSDEELEENPISPSKLAEDNYVDIFYRSNEYDPYENMSFKERITETAPTVDSLEATLNQSYEPEEEFTLEEFEEAESIPLVLDDEAESDAATFEEEETAAVGELDRSDVALLLEFGYKEELLKSVPSEDIERFSDEEFIDNITDEADGEEDGVSEASYNAEELEEERFERTKIKLQRQYDTYRKTRGGIFLRLMISAVLAVVLLFYEALPIFGVEFGGIFDRDEYFFIYALVGLQLLIFTALPAVRRAYESFKRLFSVGIDAYTLAGISVGITLLYDLIIVFENKEIPPTFHFCAAIVIVLAQLSELMRLTSEIRNYEYYFSEYIFEDDGNDSEKYKYTLSRSEGRGSIAEKMYAGGLNPKTAIYVPQSVESASGFFKASERRSKRSRAAFSWVAVSAVTALIFTIVSGIIYEDLWVAMSAFMITFDLMLPIAAILAEWLPFERLSAQNYAYGAAFASESSMEELNDCNMIVFNDLHLFEKCEAKNVNLAIYDSTSKAVLLSCLNSLYSEIGGPLSSTFSSVKVQSMGKCKINRIARSGVEALVGSSYSILVGDEQFMSRYGVFFPTAALGKEEDKIFTLCVSVNNRATARIAVKYKINEDFFNILQKLSEDKISCVVQTYDPMINTELIARVRPYKGVTVNVVHKNASDHALEMHGHKASALSSVMGEELSLMARGSRFNLAVAVSNARKLRTLRTLFNVASGALMFIGAVIALMFVLSERLTAVHEMLILLYWIISVGVTVGLMAWKFPQKDRFIFNKKKKDRK